MNKLSRQQKQNLLFGLLIDPVLYIIISFFFLIVGVSMINRISLYNALFRIIFGYAFVLALRLVLLVYNQNWIKFSLYGLVRISIAELIPCFVQYAVQYLIPVNHVSFITLLTISLLDLFMVIASRFIYYAIHHGKKGNSKLLLSSPTTYEEELQYVQEAFDKNWVAPLGFNCDGFEEEMVEYLDEDVNAFATMSGTGAIHLAVKLANVKPGDPVLCSDLTFAATVNPVVYEGAKPVFIDSEYDTWNMDPRALEKAFEKYPNAKVVVLVHLYGTPAKMDEIIDICKKHNAVLIEDAAEALGATYKGQHCGTFGKYNVLSFNGNKIITTSGGGMLLTQDKKDRDKAMFWATQSRENAPWYEHEEVGYNYRMSNVIAGIGRGQLKHLESHKRNKEVIYSRYKEGLKDLPVDMNPYLKETNPNFWLSCLTIKPKFLTECNRTETTFEYKHVDGKCCPDELATILKENNIETRPIWKPMHMQPIFKDNDFISVSDKPVSEDIFARGICLPSDIKMDVEQQERVISIIKTCF